MRHRKIYPLMLVLLCTACQKDNNGFIELFLEPIGNTGTKLVVVQDSIATWNDGDVINFNGNPVSITREDGHAYVKNVNSLSTNRACFPANLASSLGSDNITVTLPAEYHYQLSGGQQKVDMPLVARASDGEGMQFKHLTAALAITLNNTRSYALTIDRITITSDAYQLSGSRTVNLADITSFAAASSNDASNRSVQMVFDKDPMVIASGSSSPTIFIPVPPVGESNHFTITVTAHYQGTRYTYTRSQTTGGSLGRNVLAYAHQNLEGGSPSTLFDGNGTEASPYLINNACDLLIFVDACSNQWPSYNTIIPHGDKGCYYKLANNIDMTGYTITPVSSSFGAVFDGNNKSISNLTINSIITSGIAYCGLFKQLDASTIQNLTLQNLILVNNLTANNLQMGGVSSHMSNSTITNCHIDGLEVSISNISSNVTLGGITGEVEGSNTLTDCSVLFSQSFSTTAGTFKYGGLLGYCSNGTSSTLLSLSNNTVTNAGLSTTSFTTLYAGGLVGHATNIQISMTDCNWSNSMNFTGGNYLYAGGLVGNLVKSTNGRLTATGCTVTGTITGSVSGTQSVGAYVGKTAGNPPLEITSCTNNTGLPANN